MSTITAQVRTHPNLGNQSPSGEAFPLIWPLHSPRKLEKHVSDCNDEKVKGRHVIGTKMVKWLKMGQIRSFAANHVMSRFRAF